MATAATAADDRTKPRTELGAAANASRQLPLKGVEMKRLTILGVAVLSVLALAAIAFAGTGSRGGSEAASTHAHAAPSATMQTSAADLRVALNRLFGEHALLAIAATQSGYSGGKDFPALARALDRNSIELANAIGSVYGATARKEFLNGKFMWRDHIKFFVNYTVAKVQKNKPAQKRAVDNLKGYIGKFSNFLATATGLPSSALRASITEHVTQLKGQLDAYAAGKYGRSYVITRNAYKHMGMTADTLSAAIVKKFPDKFGG
ncbi:MAG: hypothetical protein ICV59_02145 [Thermoleophilia bacterium]|nr:hypothetical protein [Thermoleophilia bacterium]